jgi:thiosulfate/3-mercaptopyruvate sulfurtransferase
VILFASLSLSVAESYRHPELLVEPAGLRPGATGVVILDARPQKEYDAGHVPGALWIDADAWKKAFGDGKDADAWSKRIGSLGIGSGTRVVIYDNKKSNDAARMWWILRYWGAGQPAVLNGGWKAWQAGKLPTTKDKTPTPKPVAFKAQAHSPRLATKSQLLDSLKANRWQLVDARSSGEYCGLELHGNNRGGYMPGAKHLDWTDLIDKDTQRFKSAAELRRLFAAAGIDLDRPTATYCQSGGRASVMVFAMELLGARDVRNYYRSWHEWGNAEDTPIVKPKEPEKAKQAEKKAKP